MSDPVRDFRWWIEWTVEQLIEARRDGDWTLVGDVAGVLREVLREGE